MIFSPIRVEDAEFLASAKEKGFKDAWNLEMLLSSFKTGNFCGFIVANGEKKIGFITLSKTTPEADIETVFVCEEFRKKGVGRLLMEKAFEYLKKDGVNKLFLEVRKSNAGAISLYEKCGFKRISERRKYYIDGEDAVIYLKEL